MDPSVHWNQIQGLPPSRTLSSTWNKNICCTNDRRGMEHWWHDWGMPQPVVAFLGQFYEKKGANTLNRYQPTTEILSAKTNTEVLISYLLNWHEGNDGCQLSFYRAPHITYCQSLIIDLESTKSERAIFTKHFIIYLNWTQCHHIHLPHL